MPWASLSVLDAPSSADLYTATTRRAAHTGGPGHLPGQPGALICAARARSDACARAECCPACRRGGVGGPRRGSICQRTHGREI